KSTRRVWVLGRLRFETFDSTVPIGARHRRNGLYEMLQIADDANLDVICHAGRNGILDIKTIHDVSLGLEREITANRHGLRWRCSLLVEHRHAHRDVLLVLGTGLECLVIRESSPRVKEVSQILSNNAETGCVSWKFSWCTSQTRNNHSTSRNSGEISLMSAPLVPACVRA